MDPKNTILINAENLIIGRLASFAAKKALLGYNIIIVNSEKAIISGNKRDILEKFKQKRQRGEPYNGPFYPKQSDRILKRIIRGMLPYKKPRGREALKRIKCYVGFPEEFKNMKFIELKNMNIKSEKALPFLKYLKLEEIAKEIGGKR